MLLASQSLIQPRVQQCNSLRTDIYFSATLFLNNECHDAFLFTESKAEPGSENIDHWPLESGVVFKQVSKGKHLVGA